MLNNLVIVGRLTADPELKESESGKKVTYITVAVPRSYKNVDGEYEVDLIDCVLWLGMAETIMHHCKKGDLVGVKGRVQTRIENDIKVQELIAEKITVLSSQKDDEQQN